LDDTQRRPGVAPAPNFCLSMHGPAVEVIYGDDHCFCIVADGALLV
jgi:hypothetical protein